MPGVNVRRVGLGSPEPKANLEDTQVDNLCYERRRTGARRFGSCRQAVCRSA